MSGAWVAAFLHRLKALFRRAQLDRELEAELDFHLSMREAKHRALGLSPGEARALARRQFGNLSSVEETCRELWTFRLLAQFGQDARYAARALRRSPGFAIVAVISLALGIGGAAAMFSIVNPVLIQPLPYADPGRLFTITDYYPRGALDALQQQSRTLDIAAYTRDSGCNLTGHGQAMHLTGSFVSANLFSVLGAKAYIGRTLEEGEDLPGRDSIIVLSHALWRKAFGGDAEVLGRVISIDGVDRRVIGVMPPGFGFPREGTQVWAPIRRDPANWADYWGAGYMPLVARLRPQTTVEEARRELRSLIPRIIPLFPFPMAPSWNSDATLIPLQQDLVGGVRQKLLVLLCAVGVVLLIACANIASLLLARAAARRKEVALRASLGAGRGRIARQLLTESLVLALIGGALGLAFTIAVIAAAKSALPADTPQLAGAVINLRVAAFTAALAVLTGLAFGLAPALTASRVNLALAMKTGGQRSSTGATIRLRSLLIGSEVALAVVLVICAGLLMRSLWALTQVNPGFQAEDVLAMRVTPSQPFCAERAACTSFYDALVERARRITGVSESGVANVLPLSNETPAVPAEIEGLRLVPAENFAPLLWAGAVTPEYFRIMNIPVVRGRAFLAADGQKSELVVIVSAQTARRFWPNQDPLGKHVRVVWDQQWRTVVGVAADVRQYNLSGETPSGIDGAVYMPFAQSVGLSRRQPSDMRLLLKTAGNPLHVANEVRNLLAGINPNVPLAEVRTLNAVVLESSKQPRSLMWLFICFSATALLLAAVGCYGVISYSVTQRTYEMGVRLALGATRAALFRLVLGQGLRLVLAGLAAGIAASLALTRMLGSFLYGVNATDPATFLAVGGLLIAVAIAAAFFPACRAARVDPLTALRVD